jgi:acetyl-CoA carboxylase biotin carboxyl carrier protein
MSKDTDKSTELSIDTGLVRDLAKLISETGLTEIEYSVGDHRLRLARTPVGTVAVAAAPQVAAPPPSAIASAGSPHHGGAHPPSAADHPGAVKSPMVGTVYLSPQPEAPPFVKVGDTVSEGHVLLIIEAMKVMNQIRAPHAGRLTQLLVSDGTPVEYGQALMILE